MRHPIRAASIVAALCLAVAAASPALAQGAPAATAPSIASAAALGALPAPALAAAAYVLVDTTSGQTLAAVNADERRDPASLTKLMTAYVVFGALRGKSIVPSQMVNVSERAWRAEGSRMFIEPRKAGVGRRAPARHDRAVGQRRLDRARRAGRGQRGDVRRADEQGGAAPRHGEHALRQCDRPVRSAALRERRRSRAPRRRADPRLPRVLSDLLAARIPLQQHHAGQPQSPAVDRPVRRRREDRAHRGRRLVPDRVVVARRAQARVGRPGRGIRRLPRRGEPEAPQLRLPGLRHGRALPVRQDRDHAAGVEGRAPPKSRRASSPIAT